MRYILFSVFLFFLGALPIFAQESVIIDQFGNINCEDYLARMDNVMTQAQNNPNAKVYVFVYEGKVSRYKGNGTNETELVYPQYGLAKARIRSMKKYISKIRKYSIEQFVFVEAGFLEESMIDIRLVPAGAIPPKPEPTLTKIKYRKGKPYGFCLGCCE